MFKSRVKDRQGIEGDGCDLGRCLGQSQRSRDRETRGDASGDSMAKFAAMYGHGSLLRTVMRTNQSLALMAKTATPHDERKAAMEGMGIFWIDHGQLIITAVSLAEGVDDGSFVNGPYDHDLYDETVQCIHAHLRGLEYYRVPRGRVLFPDPCV
jgi:hypothetical protein